MLIFMMTAPKWKLAGQRYGKYFENLDKVYLRDSVIVITVKGDTLEKPRSLVGPEHKIVLYR